MHFAYENPRASPEPAREGSTFQPDLAALARQSCVIEPALAALARQGPHLVGSAGLGPGPELFLAHDVLPPLRP